MAAKLGNYNEPFVNGATLKRLYSAVVKDNIFFKTSLRETAKR